MPQKFQAQLTKIENDLLSEINREYRQVRVEALGLINELGTNSVILGGRIRALVGNFSISVTAIIRQFIDIIRQAVEDYGRRQFPTLDFDTYWLDTTPERENILNSLTGTLARVINIVELQFIQALLEMQQSNSSDTDTSHRLFALQPVDGRVSVWRRLRSLIANELQKALWSVAIAALALLFLLLKDRTDRQIIKVADATLDSRTTQTCQRVDGQRQPIDKPFILTGTPRFSNRKMLPPFHNNCRTVIRYES